MHMHHGMVGPAQASRFRPRSSKWDGRWVNAHQRNVNQIIHKYSTQRLRMKKSYMPTTTVLLNTSSLLKQDKRSTYICTYMQLCCVLLISKFHGLKHVDSHQTFSSVFSFSTLITIMNSYVVNDMQLVEVSTNPQLTSGIHILIVFLTLICSDCCFPQFLNPNHFHPHHPP